MRPDDTLLPFSHGAATHADRHLVCTIHGNDVDRLMCEGGPRCGEILPTGGYCRERLVRVVGSEESTA